MATAEELLEFLPGTDCRQCGVSCAEFAGLLLARERPPEDCPVLHEPDYAGFIEALHELLGPVAGGGDAHRPGKMQRLRHLRGHVRIPPGKL